MAAFAVAHVVEVIYIVYLLKNARSLEDHLIVLQQKLLDGQSENNIQNDLQKRLFEIQNGKYARSYYSTVIVNKEKS
jgi:ABC-type siderophore export system fused ATPase/permease subunit